VQKKVSKPAAKKIVKKATKKVVVKKSVAKKAVKKAVAKKIVAKPSVKATPAPKFVAHSTHLKAGDKAPYFEGIDQNGNTVSLNSLAGKTIIIYFYPKDDTPGCTAEACSLRDEHQYLGNNNFAVVGVSADDAKSHAKFAAKYDLPFPLIADTNMSVIKAFNVFGTKQFMGKIYDGIIRTTFVIAPDGVIKNVVKEVNTKDHAKQILAL
jgi:peroxiredoxin Q/BCP